MKKTGIALMALAVGLVSCNNSNQANNEDNNMKEANSELLNNPLVKVSDLPYQAPDFNVIKTEHFKPAIEEGIRVQKANIQAIVENEEEPTFDNTMIPLERSGEQLSRALNVFYAISGANTNDTIQELEEEFAPKLAELKDAIYLNETLFQKVKAIYDQKDDLNLDIESEKLVEDYYTDFVIAGANVQGADKERLKAINSEIASLTTEFGKILLKATNDGALLMDNVEDLEGLDESTLKSLVTEDGNYRLALQNTTQQPLSTSLKNRSVRQRLFEHSWNRADGNLNDNNTEKLVIKLVKLRAEKAAILGFDNYADWNLQKTMVKNEQNIREFFKELIPAAVEKAKSESIMIEDMMRQKGEKGGLQPWDWNYYGEMVRKAKYDLNEEEIKPYFELNTVLTEGVFYAATKLYGITFKERKDIPVYHEDVVVYELFEEDGKKLGLFYGDFYKRDNKQGGAWMSNFVDQSRLTETKPVIYNVCNFPKPSSGEPALISFDDVITMFHEFGHALHGFFADQEYISLSGTNVARDFVEFPSQFNENWATYPEVLNNYAKHYQTGKVIPEELVVKIKKANSFNQGYSLTELLAAATLDLAWHTIGKETETGEVADFENEALRAYGLDAVLAVKTRYRSTYFSHIFSGGYAAGYYAYLWTEMLDHDAYKWFEENGGMTKANGQRFRDMVLSRGNTLDYEVMYENWRNGKPEVGGMIKARGLK